MITELVCAATIFLTHTGEVRKPTHLDLAIIDQKRCAAVKPTKPCVKSITLYTKYNHRHVICSEKTEKKDAS